MDTFPATLLNRKTQTHKKIVCGGWGGELSNGGMTPRPRLHGSSVCYILSELWGSAGHTPEVFKGVLTASL